MADITINLGLTAIATGAADVITATYAPAPTLVDKKVLFLRAIAANATTTPTFNPNALGAQTITKNGGQPLAVGDISGAGFVAILVYDLPNTNWELLNPKASAAPTTFYTGDGVFTTDRDVDAQGNGLLIHDLSFLNFLATSDVDFTTTGGGNTVNFHLDPLAPSFVMYASNGTQIARFSVADTNALLAYDDTAVEQGRVNIDTGALVIRHIDEIQIQTKEQIASTLENNMFLKLVDETTGHVEFDYITFEWHSHDVGDVVATGVTSFLCAMPGTSGDSATLNLRQGIATHDGRVKKASRQTRTTQGAGGALTYTLQINGVDTAMVLVIAAGSAAGIFTASVDVDFVEDDLVNWEVNNAHSGNSAAMCAGSISGYLL